MGEQDFLGGSDFGVSVISYIATVPVRVRYTCHQKLGAQAELRLLHHPSLLAVANCLSVGVVQGDRERVLLWAGARLTWPYHEVTRLRQGSRWVGPPWRIAVPATRSDTVYKLWSFSLWFLLCHIFNVLSDWNKCALKSGLSCLAPQYFCDRFVRQIYHWSKQELPKPLLAQDYTM